MRVLFYQPDFTGHHMAYLGRMLPGVVDLPIELLLLTTKVATESTEFAKSIAPFSDRLQVMAECTEHPRGAIASSRHRLSELSAAICDFKPDHVMVCYADGIWEQAYASTILGFRPWPSSLTVEGWIFSGRFAESVDTRLKSRLRRPMFIGTLRRGLFRRLHIHHELLYKFASPSSIGTPTSVELARDPIVIRQPLTTVEARRELGITSGSDDKWIGVLGVIARFKGAHLLLMAYRNLRERGCKISVRALLAGPLHSDVRPILSEIPYRDWVADGSIVLLDRFLSAHEMYSAAAAVDLVVAPYPNHQNRSSIILWAAAAGRPAIGSDESCVDFVIKQERLGRSCQVNDPNILADAIASMLHTRWTSVDVARVRQYAEFHRVENYQGISSGLLRARLEA